MNSGSREQYEQQIQDKITQFVSNVEDADFPWKKTQIKIVQDMIDLVHLYQKLMSVDENEPDGQKGLEEFRAVVLEIYLFSFFTLRLNIEEGSHDTSKRARIDHILAYRIIKRLELLFITEEASDLISFYEGTKLENLPWGIMSDLANAGYVFMYQLWELFDTNRLPLLKVIDKIHQPSLRAIERFLESQEKFRDKEHEKALKNKYQEYTVENFIAMQMKNPFEFTKELTAPLKKNN